ncbi:MAG: twin-arginine translocation signal domain-containing protein [Candidatus Aminicenantes bacterium]|nr:twin-arginine translocation signal domain-containing protein [Candidatus Aminicenantes bacterium]
MKTLKRRDFLKMSAGTSAACAIAPAILPTGENLQEKTPAWVSPLAKGLVSPGGRTKVKVAKIYMGLPKPHWPKPSLDLQQEIKTYENYFRQMPEEFADVDFVVNILASKPEDVLKQADKIKDADGILAIHLTIWISDILNSVLSFKKPTVIFAAPYSGHEWTGYGQLMKEERGALVDCFLSSEVRDLARAIRPFRAIHHLREARILNLTTAPFEEYAAKVKEKFGTEIKRINLERVEKTYASINEAEARREAELWYEGAEKVVEPTREEVYRAARLALAFEKLIEEEQATALTIDCYGTMWDKTIKLPAYPCLGFSRLNSQGLGGICESDLRSALTHIIFQGLAGKPGFISDPTVDESRNCIILAHCLGTVNMDGPGKPGHSYKLRTVMEREEGVVPQVRMRKGEKVTQAILVGTEKLLYFTGQIVDTPVGLEDDRGCRTKIAVRVDGHLDKLWRNWSHGLHRVTCYGELSRELQMLARFKKLELINEAV